MTFDELNLNIMKMSLIKDFTAEYLLKKVRSVILEDVYIMLPS